MGVRLGTDESIAAYRAAERRLKALLLGDGMYEAGHVRGEEARARVGAQLRHLRAAFDDVVSRNEADEARIGDLEEELRARAATATRRKPARRKPADSKSAAQKSVAPKSAAQKPPARKSPKPRTS